MKERFTCSPPGMTVATVFPAGVASRHHQPSLMAAYACGGEGGKRNGSEPIIL